MVAITETVIGTFRESMIKSSGIEKDSISHPVKDIYFFTIAIPNIGFNVYLSVRFEQCFIGIRFETEVWPEMLRHISAR